MKVLYLLPDLYHAPGGIARYCHMVCRALADESDLHVLSVLDKPSARDEFKATYPTGSFEGFGGSKRAFARAALQTARQEQPDFVLSGHPNWAFIGFLAAQLARARSVAFMYGADVWQPLSRTRRLGLHRADTLFAISRYTARLAEQINGVPQSRVHILPNCLDPHFAPPRATSESNGELSLLTVARLLMPDQKKGHDQVIRAMRILRERFPSLIYNVVSDGPGRGTLEQLARDEGVSDVVKFRGVLSDEEVARHYATASAFVMPSSREGFGFVFIEAMAQGTPAVGGNKDATPEVIVDGVTGYTVDPTSVEAIADACARLLENADLRVQMGRAAQEHVAKTFSFDAFKAQLLRDISPKDAR